MGVPIAKKGDPVFGVDTHVLEIEGHLKTQSVRFVGAMVERLSSTVFIDDKPAALVGSVAKDMGGHLAFVGSFVIPPAKTAVVAPNDCSVFIDNVRAARKGDKLDSCSDVGECGTSRLSGDCTVVTD
jgi:uncharacterized Zn-binding protein involved in type VI secretion